MLKIKEAIIVEGRYDKIRLSSIVDTVIIETGGFRIFSNGEKLNLIRTLAEKRGIIVFTDSDGAGFIIRNHLNGALDKNSIKHAYIPQIQGKEKRKEKPSKQGFLGVEGIDDEVLINAIIRSGATVCDGENIEIHSQDITKADFYDLGLIGCDKSKSLREKLLKKMNFPTYMSTKAMLSAFNILMDRYELENLVKTVLSE